MAKLEKFKDRKIDTLYILGAGASMAYGYPSGEALKKSIISLGLKYKQEPDHLFCQIIRNKEKNLKYEEIGNVESFDNLLGKFFSDFEESSASTIDSFVGRNPTYLDHAKVVVAYILIAKYSEGAYDTEAKNCGLWVESYLNKRIGSNIGEYKKHPDYFLTFNYDLSLENLFVNYFKHQVIDSKLKINAEEFVLNELPIYHIYGHLRWREFKKIYNKLHSKKASSIKLSELIDLSSEIKFIEGDRQAYEAHIQAIVQSAGRIVLLGYGYDQLNNKLLFGKYHDFCKVMSRIDYFSTAVGLNKEEIHRLSQMQTPEESYVGTLEEMNRTAPKEVSTVIEPIDCKDFLEKYILVRKFFEDEEIEV